jgi:predicted lipoprotein
MTKVGDAPIVRESGIADPDEFTWGCDCKKCQVKYQQWKVAFNAEQQKELAAGLKRTKEVVAGAGVFYGLPQSSVSAPNAGGKRVTDGETSP